MIQGKVEPGDLVAYTMYVTTLLTTIRRIIEFAEQFQRGITGIERFQEIMDVVPDIKDSKNAKKMEHVKGAISFDHVSFEYPDDHVPVLEDINITVRPGERIALVGPSGGGKTTMCNLLPRFYDTTSGSITIDGQDIKNVTLQSLRSNIGVVQQDVYLFSGSVYENISYGRPGATRKKLWKLPNWQAPMSLSLSCRTDMIRMWASGGQAVGRTEAAYQHCPCIPEEPGHSNSG